MERSAQTVHKKRNIGELYSKYGVMIILVVIFIVASILSKNFLTQANLTNVLRQIVVITIVGFGGTFILISAQINIAYDALLAAIGCMSCITMVKTESVLLSLVVGIAIGAVIGWAYGFFVTFFNMPAFIVGLAINTIARGAILMITGGKNVSGLGKFSVIGQGYIGPIPIPVIIMFVLLLVCWIILNKTCFGRHVFAVGGNPAAAVASGINADSVIRKVYVIDGIMTAVAGIIFMSRMASGQPSAGDGYAFDAITAVVVGGASLSGGSGNIIGTIIGAAIVGVINNLMNLMNVSSYWQQIVKGVIILLAVIIDVQTKKATSKAKKD